MAAPNSERRLAAVARLLKLVRETDDFDTLIKTLLQSLQEEFHYPVIWLGLYNPAQQHVTSCDYIAPHPHRLLESTFTLTAGDLIEQVLIQQRPLLISDLRVEPRVGHWKTLAETFDIQGALLFPVRRREVCHGLILFGTSYWGQTIDASDRTFLATIGGILADVLHEREQAQQAERTQNVSQCLAQLIGHLKEDADRDRQLNALAHSLFEFITPDRVRVFWLDPGRFEFWERLTLSSTKKGGCVQFSRESSSLAISPADMGGAYQSLHTRQSLVVGESQSSLATTIPEKFLQLLNARALMLAPIFQHQTLEGFISVECKLPRLWADRSRDYLTMLAGLAGLLAPIAAVESLKQQQQTDLQLLTGMIHSIQSDQDWQETLDACSKELLQQLESQHLLVLQHDAERKEYTLAFHKSVASQKSLPRTWPNLDEVDWQMLIQRQEAIGVNDLTTDLKFFPWQDNLRMLQAKALLVCNVFPGKSPAGVVLLISHRLRYWQPSAGQLFQRFAEQVGLILNQWQLQRQTERQKEQFRSLEWGLQEFRQSSQLVQLEDATNRHATTLLGIPLAVQVTWKAGASTASIGQAISDHAHFSVDSTVEVSVPEDTMIAWAVQADGPLVLGWEDLPEETRHWLSCPAGSKCLIVALQTADDSAPAGLWLLAATPDYQWTNYRLSLVELLASQLAWSRRYLNMVNALKSQTEDLAALNWYKHYQFEEIHRHLQSILQRINNPITRGKGLTAQRQLQVVREVNTLNARVQETLEQEAWRIKSRLQTMSLDSLMERSMERVAPLAKQRDLKITIHTDNSQIALKGDLRKITPIFYEIIASACRRSPPHEQVDIWCHPLEETWLELLVADSGDVPEALIVELQNHQKNDILAPSLLQVPPGLHLSVCQTLIQTLGGSFSLQKGDDDRTISRITLAILEPTAVDSVPS